MRGIRLLAVGSLLAMAVGAFGAPVKSQWVTFASGSDTVSAYLATPDSPGKYPGLVVLHEDWGLTEWPKERARDLAGHGYVALAVDLYHGQVAHEPSYAYELMVSVPPGRALQDMEAAIHYLIARPDVDKDAIGSIGWSAGGKWALLLAVHDPFLAACVANYGTLPTDPADIQKIRAPVLGIYGAEDRYISVNDVEAFENAMSEAHKTVEIKIYRGASSGFENPGNTLDYRQGAADDAWQRTLAFLDRHLKNRG